jgi:localization factor PodJL
MKAFCLFTIASLALTLTAPTGHAQSARQLTRKVVPQPPNQTPAKPTPPPATTRPPAVAPSQPVVVPLPVDPVKEKAKQAEALKKTIEFQKKRAEEGSPSAQYELGLRYLRGDGLEKDVATGRKWLEKSAQQDYSPAKKKLEELNEEKKR